MHTLQYTCNAVALWLSSKIDFQTLRYALRKRPAAVAGKGGSYAVDPDHE